MLFEGFWLQTDGWMDRQTDIGGCRVAIATENYLTQFLQIDPYVYLEQERTLLVPPL